VLGGEMLKVEGVATALSQTLRQESFTPLYRCSQ
jgi:hypothetical protein